MVSSHIRTAAVGGANDMSLTATARKAQALDQVCPRTPHAALLTAWLTVSCMASSRLDHGCIVLTPSTAPFAVRSASGPRAFRTYNAAIRLTWRQVSF